MPIISQQTLVYKITSILIDLNLEIIVLKVAKGIMDGEAFIPLSEETVPINQQDTSVLSNTICNKRETIYFNIKETLYNYLIDSGKIPGKIV